MIKKVEKKGKNIGNEFWACSAFPKFRHTEAGNV
jgi:ssDNA-binding Zn-finger/Zn-ribbon topoisomerase 1|tara:strand:- start:808 stop:909 length:102 start_codon:yes stop_codon:yes gene_type:complete